MKKIFLTLTLVLFVIPFGMSQDLPSYVPTDGLLAYYPFNGNANDESGNGNHGTVNGAILTSDRNQNENSSYMFENSNISIENQFYNNGFENYTINIWFLTNSPTKTMQCLLNTIPHDGEGIGYNHENALNTFSHGKNSNVSQHLWDIFSSNPFGIEVQQNMWYMLTIIKNSSDYNYYVNNSLEKTSTTSSTAENQNTGLTFGSTSLGSEYIHGKLDDIGIWNRALSQQEIQNLYTSSTGDILFNGVVSAENNQIKNVADPTDAQDAVTKNYTYSKTEVDALIANLQQQINEMNQAITSSELEGNWNVKELYYLNPDTNEITSTFPTPECSKPYQYYEFLVSKEIFWTGIGTNWVTQSCTSNEFGVKQDPYTITTENSYGDDPITYINFPNGSNTRNWEIISRPSENTIIIRAWQNNEVSLYNNQVHGIKLVKEPRIESNFN